VELRGYNSNAVPQRFLLHNHDDIYLLSRKRRLNLTLIIVVSIMAATGAVTAVSGQLTSASSPSWVNLLVQLRSNDSEVRSGAFDQLRLDPTALRDPEVKAALVNLLDRENEETVTGDEEDYSMYVDTLSDTVTKLVDWSDPRQVCILANSVYPPAELADHARIAVPCLLRRLKKNVPHTFQGQVVAMMVQALAKGKRELDPAAMQAARQATLSGLHDPDEGIRMDTVNALGKFGGEDMIPALRVVAEKDPAIREWAAEAIVAIQQQTAAIASGAALIVSGTVLGLLWRFGVWRYMQVGGTDLRVILWPSSQMLTAGWCSTLTGILITTYSVAINCWLYIGIGLLLRGVLLRMKRAVAPTKS